MEENSTIFGAKNALFLQKIVLPKMSENRPQTLHRVSFLALKS